MSWMYRLRLVTLKIFVFDGLNQVVAYGSGYNNAAEKSKNPNMDI